MIKRVQGVVAATVILGLTACGGPPKPRTPREPERAFRPATAMLVPYAGPDGSLTRDQMESGLRRDFARADINHDGCLDNNEVRTVNDARWKADASSASPLIDFKQNGCIDFDEFAATPRSIFDSLDRDGTGKLTAKQLNSNAKPATAPATAPDSQSGGRHRGGGQPPGGNGGP